MSWLLFSNHCHKYNKYLAYSLQHCVEVLMSLVNEEDEMVSDFHLEDLVRVLLLEFCDQWTTCVLDEPEIQIRPG